MSRNRLTTAVLVALLSASVLSGCTRKQPEQVAAPAAPKAAAPAAAASADLPDPRLLRRHPPAHGLVDGCRCCRRQPAAGRRVSLRQGRGGHRRQRTEGEAVASSGFPGGCRSLRPDGIDHRPQGRQARASGRAHGQALVRPDAGGEEPTKRSWTSSRTSRRASSPRRSSTSRERPATSRHGKAPSRPRKTPTSRASSPPSSATSGPRW